MSRQVSVPLVLNDQVIGVASITLNEKTGQLALNGGNTEMQNLREDELANLQVVLQTKDGVNVCVAEGCHNDGCVGEFRCAESRANGEG
jgi:hypothetical protein